MNRRQFLKKSLESIVITSIPLISSCGKNPVSYELEDIFIDKRMVADAFGNHDGTASEDELNFIDNYFKSNLEAWADGVWLGKNLDKNEISLSEVINLIKRLEGPFKSEVELREHHKLPEGVTPKVTTVLINSAVPSQESTAHRGR